MDLEFKKILSKKKHITMYFCIVLITGIVFSLLDNYGPLFFMLASYPIFVFLFYKYLFQFSNHLKIKEPTLFSGFASGYGSHNGKVVSVLSLFNNSHFKNIKSNILREEYKLVLRTFMFLTLSFFLTIPITMLTIWF